MRLLLVEDERAMAAALRKGLESEGFVVEHASDGPSGLQAARFGGFDAVLLDVMLPGMSGYTVVRTLRSEDNWVPVLMISAKDGEYDQADGLDYGADDYLVKPFSPAELVARVEALGRRLAARAQPAAPDEPPLVFDGLVIDRAGRRVVVHGSEVELTQREFDLLAFLAGEPGRAFSRDQLMDAVWGFPFYTDTSTVTVHVRRVRAKIEADPANPVRLQTVWGVGYRFSP